MNARKFSVGDLVRLQLSDQRSAVSLFEVMRALPAGEHDGEPQYHVKSVDETHARAVKERQLQRASSR